MGGVNINYLPNIKKKSLTKKLKDTSYIVKHGKRASFNSFNLLHNRFEELKESEYISIK